MIERFLIGVKILQVSVKTIIHVQKRLKN